MPESLADPLARATDPVTSHWAADSMQTVAGMQCRRIMKVLRASTCPMAAEQIADVLPDMDHVAVNRRLADLARLGHVIKTEQLHRNRSRRRAHKFALTDPQAGLFDE